MPTACRCRCPAARCSWAFPAHVTIVVNFIKVRAASARRCCGGAPRGGPHPCEWRGRLAPLCLLPLPRLCSSGMPHPGQLPGGFRRRWPDPAHSGRGPVPPADQPRHVPERSASWRPGGGAGHTRRCAGASVPPPPPPRRRLAPCRWSMTLRAAGAAAGTRIPPRLPPVVQGCLLVGLHRQSALPDAAPVHLVDACG